MGMFWHLPAISVPGHLSPIISLSGTATEIFYVIPHREHHLVRHNPVVHQIQHQHVHHLFHYQPGLLEIIRALEYLPGAKAGGFRPVRLDIRNRTGFPAPGMVNQQFRIDAKHPIKKILIIIIRFPAQGAPGDVPHGMHALGLQLPGIPGTHPPEISNGAVFPQEPAVTHLIQLRDAHPVLVRLNMLRLNIHGNLAQVKVAANPRRGRDSCLHQHIPYDGHGQLLRSHLIGGQIMGHIQKHFVNGIHMDVLRRNILQVNLINPGTVFHIQGHPGRRHHVGKFQGSIGPQLGVIAGSAGKSPPRRFGPPPIIFLPHLLNHLEQPGPSRNPIGFQRGRYCQADSFFRTALICHHQIGNQGVHIPLHALHRCIE